MGLLLLSASPQPALLAAMSPAQATLLLTGSLLLIAWELNRPGSILPGALGVLGSLFAVAAICRFPLRLSWAAVLLLCVGTLGSNLGWQVPWYLLAAATAGLALALRELVAAPVPVPWALAVLCGAVLGGAGSVLARLALRARRAKQVN